MSDINELDGLPDFPYISDAARSDPTPTAGAPERIGVEFSATVESWSDEHPALIGIRPGDDCREYPRIGERVTVHRSVGPLAHGQAAMTTEPGATERLRAWHIDNDPRGGYLVYVDGYEPSRVADATDALILARAKALATDPAPDHALHFDPDCEECAYLARPTRETLAATSREAGLDAECPEPDCRKVAGHTGPHFPVPGDGTPDSLRGGGTPRVVTHACPLCGDVHLAAASPVSEQDVVPQVAEV